MPVGRVAALAGGTGHCRRTAPYPRASRERCTRQHHLEGVLAAPQFAFEPAVQQRQALRRADIGPPAPVIFTA